MGIRFDQILSDATDFEKRQYLILRGLRDYSSEFTQNRLYPFLSELVDLYRTMLVFREKHDDLRDQLPQELKDIDVENLQLVYEPAEATSREIEEIVNLIVWALPAVKSVMEEGMSIHNFVDENIGIVEVGITPIYRDEGYWFVPDGRSDTIHVLRYEMSLFTASRERYRTLRTRAIESVYRGAQETSLESIKWMLMRKYHDLPNPATYACETDLDFPYGETILPVAKRKLMNHLSA